MLLARGKASLGRCDNMASPEISGQRVSPGAVRFDLGVTGQTFELRAPRGFVERVVDWVTGKSAQVAKENELAKQQLQSRLLSTFVDGTAEVQVPKFDVAGCPLDKRIVRAISEATDNARAAYFAVATARQLKASDQVMGLKVGDVLSDRATFDQFIGKVRQEIRGQSGEEAGAATPTKAGDSMAAESRMRDALFLAAKGLGERRVSDGPEVSTLQDARAAVAAAETAATAADLTARRAAEFLGGASDLASKLRGGADVAQAEVGAAKGVVATKVQEEVRTLVSEVSKQKRLAENAATRADEAMGDAAEARSAYEEANSAAKAARKAADEIANLAGRADPRTATADRNAKTAERSASKAKTVLDKIEAEDRAVASAEGHAARATELNTEAKRLAAAGDLDGARRGYEAAANELGSAQADYDSIGHWCPRNMRDQLTDMHSAIADIHERTGNLGAAAHERDLAVKSIGDYSFASGPTRAKLIARLEAEQRLAAQDHEDAGVRAEAEGNHTTALAELKAAILIYESLGENNKAAELRGKVLIAEANVAAKPLADAGDHKAAAAKLEERARAQVAAGDNATAAILFEAAAHECEVAKDRPGAINAHLQAANAHIEVATKCVTNSLDRNAAKDSYMAAEKQFRAAGDESKARGAHDAASHIVRESAQQCTTLKMVKYARETIGHPEQVRELLEPRLTLIRNELSQGVFSWSTISDVARVFAAANMYSDVESLYGEVLHAAENLHLSNEATQARAGAAKATMANYLTLFANTNGHLTESERLAALHNRSPEELVAEAHGSEDIAESLRQYSIIVGADLHKKLVKQNEIQHGWMPANAVAAVSDELFLAACKPNAPGPDVDRSMSLIKPMIRLQQNAEDIFLARDSEAAQVIAEGHRDAIRNLEPGGKYLMYSGWTDLSAFNTTHAMYCSFERKDNGKYRICVYNAGYGADLFQEIRHQENRYLVEPLNLFFDDVDEEDMFPSNLQRGEHPLNLERLTLDVMGLTGPNAGDITSVRDCFLRNRRLAAKQAPPDRMPELLVRVQDRTGSCARKSLSCLIAHHINDPSENKSYSLRFRISQMEQFIRRAGGVFTDPTKRVYVDSLLEGAENTLSILRQNRFTKSKITEEQYQAFLGTITTALRSADLTDADKARVESLLQKNAEEASKPQDHRHREAQVGQGVPKLK